MLLSEGISLFLEYCKNQRKFTDKTIQTYSIALKQFFTAWASLVLGWFARHKAWTSDSIKCLRPASSYGVALKQIFLPSRRRSSTEIIFWRTAWWKTAFVCGGRYSCPEIFCSRKNLSYSGNATLIKLGFYYSWFSVTNFPRELRAVSANVFHYQQVSFPQVCSDFA